MNDDRIEMEVEITKLKSEKSDLCQLKNNVQSELSALNAEVRGRRVSGGRYAAVVKRQEDIKREIASYENRIVELSRQISAIGSKIHISNLANKVDGAGAQVVVNPKVDVIRALVEIRDEYEAFAADSTRVRSTALMAADFARKLTKLIRAL